MRCPCHSLEHAAVRAAVFTQHSILGFSVPLKSQEDRYDGKREFTTGRDRKERQVGIITGVSGPAFPSSSDPADSAPAAAEPAAPPPVAPTLAPPSQRERDLLAAAIALYCLAVGHLVLMRHKRFASTVFDLGIFDQSVWLLSRGRAPLASDRCGSGTALYAPAHRSTPEIAGWQSATAFAESGGYE